MGACMEGRDEEEEEEVERREGRERCPGVAIGGRRKRGPIKLQKCPSSPFLFFCLKLFNIWHR